MKQRSSTITTKNQFFDLNEKSLNIFRLILDTYLETGTPVGSKTLSTHAQANLSSASIRNIMAHLEEMGLLYAPHTSAGRMPTHLGLKFFVQSLMQWGDLSVKEKELIDQECQLKGKSFSQFIEDISDCVSGMSRCASLVFVPQNEVKLKHIEFLRLNEETVLVIIVCENGQVENRLLELPKNIEPYLLQDISNYLNHHMKGASLNKAKAKIMAEIANETSQLQEKAAKWVEKGVLSLINLEGEAKLIVKGQSALLEDVAVVSEIEQMKNLLKDLENKKRFSKLIDKTNEAAGVQIFIGAENNMFSHTNCAMVMAPYVEKTGSVLGAVGVIGPTRMNYSRIVPMVDYTAQVLGRLLERFH